MLGLSNRPPLAELVRALQGDLPDTLEEWSALLALANETLTVGTLAHRLMMTRDNALPADVRQFLSTIQERVSTRNGMMDDQLEEALAALNRQGLVPILIKGTALRVGNPAKAQGRLLSDLDLVLPASSRANAVSALEAIGYARYEPDVDGGSPNAAVLFRTRDPGMIDLHFSFRAAGLGYDAEDLAFHCQPAAVGQAQALLPDPSTQAALLVMHDQIKDQDYWRGLIDLRHLLDLQALAPDVDWDRVSAQFPSGYAQAALQTQLVALRQMIGVPVPARMTGGWWPRLQHRRRLVQLRWPALARLLSYLTFMADLVAGRLFWHRIVPGRLRRDRPQTGGSGHFLREKAIGKV